MPPHWDSSLRQRIQCLRARNQSPRIAIVGIGNALCGDDAAGVMIARGLRQRTQPHCSSQLLTLDAGLAPENVCGALRRFAPGLVVLVDAADMGAAPGQAAWLACDDADGLSASTHRLPLSLFAQYVADELGCEVALLGIQPADVSMGAPLSPPVRRAVKRVIRALADLCHRSE